MKKHLLEYRRGFRDFINWKNRIEANNGIQDNLELAKQSFLQITKINKKFYLDSMFLSLELVVKDFLLSYDLKYSKIFTFKYNNLKRNILYEKDISQEQRDTLILELNKYYKYFSKMIVIFTTTGTSLNIGIIGDMQVEIKESQGYIDMLIKNSEKLRVKRIHKSELIILLLNSIWSLLILLIIFLIFRKLIKSERYLNIATQKLIENPHKENIITMKNIFIFNNIIKNFNQFVNKQIIILNKYEFQHSETIKLTDNIYESISNNKQNIKKIYNYLSNGNLYLKSLENKLPQIQSNIAEQNSKMSDMNYSINQEIKNISHLEYNIALYEEKVKILNIEFKEFNSNFQNNSIQNITFLVKILDALKLLSVNSAIESSKVGKDGENISIIADEIRQVEQQIFIEITRLKTTSSEIIKSLGSLQKTLNEHSIPISDMKLSSQKLNRYLRIIGTQIEVIVNFTENSQQNIKSVLEASKTPLEDIRESLLLSKINIEHIDNSSLITIKLKEIWSN